MTFGALGNTARRNQCAAERIFRHCHSERR